MNDQTHCFWLPLVLIVHSFVLAQDLGAPLESIATSMVGTDARLRLPLRAQHPDDMRTSLHEHFCELLEWESKPQLRHRYTQGQMMDSGNTSDAATQDLEFPGPRMTSVNELLL
eukprot:4047886-Amphidinium_carterae.2